MPLPTLRLSTSVSQPKKESTKRIRAAKLLQFHWRRYLARTIDDRAKKKAKRNCAARIIQQRWKAYVAFVNANVRVAFLKWLRRKKVLKRKFQLAARIVILQIRRSALVIQRAMKMNLAVNKQRRLQRQQAARAIQRCWVLSRRKAFLRKTAFPAANVLFEILKLHKVETCIIRKLEKGARMRIAQEMKEESDIISERSKALDVEWRLSVLRGSIEDAVASLSVGTSATVEDESCAEKWGEVFLHFIYQLVCDRTVVRSEDVKAWQNLVLLAEAGRCEIAQWEVVELNEIFKTEVTQRLKIEKEVMHFADVLAPSPPPSLFGARPVSARHLIGKRPALPAAASDCAPTHQLAPPPVKHTEATALSVPTSGVSIPRGPRYFRWRHPNLRIALDGQTTKR